MRGQIGRRSNFDHNVEIAFASAVQTRHAFAAESQCGAALRAGRNRDFYRFSVQTRNIDFGAERGARDVDCRSSIEILPPRALNEDGRR